MKKYSLLCLFSILFVIPSFSQQKINPKDLYGQWKLHIDIQEAMKEAADDRSFIENVLISGVSDIVESILNEVTVTFDFQKNNELVLTIAITIEDTETEVENLKWNLNSKNQLIIEDIDNDQVQLQNEGFWLLKNGVLINFDEQGDFQEHVYLVRE
jgi:archaellum component FlaF (FlaF/FlaG flagellin family)|tara:strand:- start:641 stop:1108 length:468 start_codon:yes stop_codon:yes gene_type:complete